MEEDDNVQNLNGNRNSNGFVANNDGSNSKKEIQSYNFGNNTNSNQNINSGNLTLPVNAPKGNKAPPPPPVRGATAVGVQPPRPATMNRLKQSDSSFGLHSPDNLPVGFSSGDGETVDLMKKLIDHDLIDLTMIPPPMTPDEV